jgi:hypothetical protein
MKEQVHKHIVSELERNTRTDTIFIISAVLINLITLAVNSSLAEESRIRGSFMAVMVVFVALTVVVNLVALVGLLKGKQTRSKLIKGLIRMYQDENVDGYYDTSLLHNYDARYNLFILVVCFTGIVSIIVPFIIR